MKKCPSCNTDCDDAAEVCPSCGYQFEVVAEDSGKRTMMGFPSLSDGVEDAEELEAPDPVKQTLFGFPAQKGEGDGQDAPVEESEPEDSGEYAATAVLSPDQFEFPEKDAEQEDDLRGTVAGMALDERAAEDDDDDKTQIVSGTAVFPGNQAGADPDDAGEGLRAKGTLMGMSLEEAAKGESDAAEEETEENPGRATQFAIPAAQSGEEPDLETVADAPLHLDEESEESEEPIDDAPTQAWSPESLGVTSKSDPDQGRKKLLEKIRKSRPTNRETSKGLPSASSNRTKSGVGTESPDLSALRKLRPKRELKATPAGLEDSDRETDENEQASPPSLPGSPAAEKRSELRKGPPPAGASSYLLGRDSSKPKGVAIGSILRKKEDSRVEPEEVEQPAESADLGDALSDPSFGLAETGVASGDLLRQAGVVEESHDGQVEDLSGPAFEQNHDASAQGQQRSPTTQQGVGSPIESTPMRTPAPPEDQPASPEPADDQLSAGQRRAPAHTPNPPRQFGGQSAHGSQRASPGVYETFDGAQSSPDAGRPQGQAGHAANPAKQTNQPTPDAMDDPLVRQIQTLFGILAGAIVLIVQGVVIVVDGTPAITGSLVVAFACMLGVAAIVAAAFPVASKIRSILLLAVAALLVVSIVIGIAVALPKTFLVVGLAALVAMMAAAFPYVARYLL